ncbi:Transcriptional coactivator p15 (modular protein) [Methylocella tundrae]|uniref:Transcriptional coactivator p15 (Modular protein) n=1 Tax=Methylocella tundrae TaxID=227605 RepID=A0A8B6MBT9_METTU|nr:PC4/YdbC family ssDNA-binding protein [Methylocella tundrae]VTZ28459.1 Transcriptional coactivator p15 (modular protein) [Methylocella tundrae]VTZ52191.1 Transcriptional coactivator p15 (modular protein) [Methylocella tundrae]
MSAPRAGDGVLIGYVEKSKAELIGVFLKDFEGFRYVDIRVYDRAISGRPTPTTKGVAIRPTRLPELVKLLEAALATLDEGGGLLEPRVPSRKGGRR